MLAIILPTLISFKSSLLVSFVVSQIDISLWLKYYSLSQYERHFRDLQIKTIGDLKETMICDDVMDELEVMVPGDRKRLAMAGMIIKQSYAVLQLVSQSCSIFISQRLTCQVAKVLLSKLRLQC